VLTATVLAALVAGPASPVAADPADPAPLTAQREATELRLEVDRLRLEVALAVEHHNAVAEAHASVVRRHLHADRAADAATATRVASEGRSVRRVRALYMAGGGAALYAGLLDDRGITDVLRRTQTVTVLTRADAGIGAADLARARAAAADAAELSARTHEQVRLAQEVEKASVLVETLLRESTDRLAGADAQVARLAEAERDRLHAEAEGAARTQLAAAGVYPQGAAGSTRGPDQAPAPAAANAVGAARSMLGRPYRWGAVGPNAFDCSGLIQWAYRQAGVALPRVSRDQFRAGAAVSLGALAPGDVLFYAVDTADPASIYHVGMYLGDGELIQSPHTGSVVHIAPVRLRDLIGAIRPVPSQPSLRTP
jgi:cell wall-associated NlpC family hydrolase